MRLNTKNHLLTRNGQRPLRTNTVSKQIRELNQEQIVKRKGQVFIPYDEKNKT